MVLTQTHPAAPYVCRTGNITLRCQYDGVENVLFVLWNVDDLINLNSTDLMTLPGHTALDRTESHQDLVIASFADLRGTYQCAVIQSTDLTSSPQLSPGPVEGVFDTVICIVLYHLAVGYCIVTYIPTIPILCYINRLISAESITLSALTLASRTATTLSVTWSAGYPKCYSFTVSHSTQDGSINVTQPADSDTSHTLTSLQPGITYRIEVEAVRKGEGADGQRAKVMWIFSTGGQSKRDAMMTMTTYVHMIVYTIYNAPCMHL